MNPLPSGIYVEAVFLYEVLLSGLPLFVIAMLSEWVFDAVGKQLNKLTKIKNGDHKIQNLFRRSSAKPICESGGAICMTDSEKFIMLTTDDNKRKHITIGQRCSWYDLKQGPIGYISLPDKQFQSITHLLKGMIIP